MLLAIFLTTLASATIPPTAPSVTPLSSVRSGMVAPRSPSSNLRGSDSLDVRLYAQLLQAADQRALDTTLIATALASSDPEIRRVAARTLSQVAPRRRAAALPMLRALVHDPDSSVAGTALFGVGLVRDTASVARMTSIVRAGGASAPAAAWALGEIGKSAADSVAELLREPQRSGGVDSATRRELLIAASKVRPLKLSAVEPYLASPSAELRWAAAYSIARARSRAGISALLDAKSPDARFRAELARVLASSSVGDSLHDRAIMRLRALVRDANPYVRINALHSMGSFGAIARTAILHALHDRDANVRVAAAQSAATAFDTATAAWREAWTADTSYKVRGSLLEGAASRGVLLPGATAWLASTDWRLRHVAVAAWNGSTDTTRARSVALDAIKDADARVRMAAYGVLVSTDTARRDSVVRRALDAARTDPDSMVRHAAEESRSRNADSAPDTVAVQRPVEWYEDAVRRIVVSSLRGHPPRAVMNTERGRIVITFDGVLAPLTVLNFATLAEKHTYDHLRFHRVVPGFVAQDGDPRGDGEGGPGYSIRDELTLLPYARGAVGMALSGPDTGGSQYFLTLTPQPHLTGHYTVFGMVTSGLGAMDALVEGDAINSVRISW